MKCIRGRDYGIFINRKCEYCCNKFEWFSSTDGNNCIEIMIAIKNDHEKRLHLTLSALDHTSAPQDIEALIQLYPYISLRIFARTSLWEIMGITNTNTTLSLFQLFDAIFLFTRLVFIINDVINIISLTHAQIWSLFHISTSPFQNHTNQKPFFFVFKSVN